MTMANGSPVNGSTLTVSNSSSTSYCDNNSFFLDQYISYNSDKNRFSWNSTLEDLETFIDTRLSRLIDDAGNGEKSTKSYNSSCAILKLPNATVNFYRSTKTLQVQEKAAADV